MLKTSLVCQEFPELGYKPRKAQMIIGGGADPLQEFYAKPLDDAEARVREMYLVRGTNHATTFFESEQSTIHIDFHYPFPIITEQLQVTAGQLELSFD